MIKEIERWRRKGKITYWLSLAAMLGAMVTTFSGMAFFTLLLLISSMRLSTESEICNLKGSILKLAHNQDLMLIEETPEQ